MHVCVRCGKAAQVQLGCTEGSGSPAATFQPCGPTPQGNWPEVAALVGEKRVSVTRPSWGLWQRTYSWG